MNLSRRSLLNGLLSSAAVIAAGPVAKIAVVDDGFGIGPAMQALPVGPTFEDCLAMINCRIGTVVLRTKTPLPDYNWRPA